MPSNIRDGEFYVTFLKEKNPHEKLGNVYELQGITDEKEEKESNSASS
jgi:hypothetical protein